MRATQKKQHSETESWLRRALAPVRQRSNPGPDEAELALGNALEAELRADGNIAALRRVFDTLADLANLGLPAAGRNIIRVSLDPASPATADLQLPEGPGPHPVLVYLHGGAWVAGSPKSHRKLTARFARAGYLVISVDYRLAPEHPFPAGLDDCIAAVHWAARNAQRFGGDPRRLAIGGDSAGANLAAATALSLRGRLGAPKIHAAVLIYGVFDMSDMGSVEANRFLHRAYLPGSLRQALSEPRVSPIHAAQELPRCFIVVGSRDTLLAQNRALSERLSAAGVHHVYVEERGMPHGFMQMEFLGRVSHVVGRAAEFLETQLPARSAPPLLSRLRRSWARIRAGSIR